MVFLKLVHTQYQVNHKTQPFWVKVVHLVPNVQTLAGHDVGVIRLAQTIKIAVWGSYSIKPNYGGIVFT